MLQFVRNRISGYYLYDFVYLTTVYVLLSYMKLCSLQSPVHAVALFVSLRCSTAETPVMDRIAVGHVLFVYFIFGCLRKITINEYYLRHVSVCTSVRLEQLGSHWTDFHEILCLKIFLKSVKKILAKLRKTTITFVVYLCVRPLGTTRLPLDGFS